MTVENLLRTFCYSYLDRNDDFELQLKLIGYQNYILCKDETDFSFFNINQ